MSVLIKGMKMPKDCRECPFEMYYFHCGETRCRATLRTLATDFKSIPFDGRADDCPIIELPPHGDLIDRDPFIEFIKTHWDSYDQLFVAQIEARPAIIPAERSEE